MRKRDPDDVVAGFARELRKSLQDFESTVRALQRAPLDLRRAVARDAFLRAATGFEVFRSDWTVAAINRDSSRLVAEQEEKLKQLLAERFAAFGDHITTSFPKHLTLEQIHTILDPKEFNVAIPSSEEWKSYAEKYIQDPYRERIRRTLTTCNSRVVDSVIGIRNALAHHSANATKTMNEKLRVLPNDLRRPQNSVKPSGIPGYLYAQPNPPDGPRRVTTYHTRLIEIVESLRVGESAAETTVPGSAPVQADANPAPPQQDPLPLEIY